MKLGKTALVSVNTSNFAASLSFYQAVGFQSLAQKQAVNAALLSDGFIFLWLNQHDENSSALSYCGVDNLTEVTAQLTELNLKLIEKNHDCAIFITPDNLIVKLHRAEITAGHQLAKEPLSKCGRFYELSIEVDDLNAAIEFWQQFEFAVEFSKPSANFATLHDGNIRLGLYRRGSCPHKFKSPSITYFESDMAARIEKLKQAGISLIEDLPDKEGRINDAIVEAPDGQYLFLFYYEW